jgi:uncharacterized protein YkwD
MRRSVLPALLLLAAAGCRPNATAATSAGAPAPASEPTSQLGMTREVARLVNEHRASISCPALVWDALAARAAQHHSDDMYRRNYFSHTSPERRGVGERLHDVGADWVSVAENIAMGPRTARAAVEGWLASPAHRRNIENCRYTHTGVGVREGRWTQVFLTPP